MAHPSGICEKAGASPNDLPFAICWCTAFVTHEHLFIEPVKVWILMMPVLNLFVLHQLGTDKKRFEVQNTLGLEKTRNTIGAGCTI
jgi:hypothetical protein